MPDGLISILAQHLNFKQPNQLVEHHSDSILICALRTTLCNITTVVALVHNFLELLRLSRVGVVMYSIPYD